MHECAACWLVDVLILRFNAVCVEFVIKKELYHANDLICHFLSLLLHRLVIYYGPDLNDSHDIV